jgi:hypothetical protein
MTEHLRYSHAESGPHSQLAPPGTSAGDQRKDEFLAGLLDVLGDVRMLWVPDVGDTTTSTDRSRHAATITWDASIAGRLSAQGSGLMQEFDASNDEGDLPYNARYYFGDGAVDEAFSIVALVRADDATPSANSIILSAWNEDTDAELRFYRTFLIATDGHPRLDIYDESANAFLRATDETVLTAATDTLLIFTYDGSGSESGIKILVNGVAATTTLGGSGTYVAMEDPGATEKLLVGHNLSTLATPVAEGFWDGQMGFVALTAKDISVHEAEVIVRLTNGFYDLAL